ncbi:MAG TPA: hypothetical protein VH143_20720 [Kofleriaceae bacterium]|jgi:hypothetical protein|nr:hypothetical protein [Kofleriaceae bacterium]
MTRLGLAASSRGSFAALAPRPDLRGAIVLAIVGIAILPLAIVATIYAAAQLDDLDAKLLADARPHSRDVLLAAKALGLFGTIVGGLALAALAIVAAR